MKNISASELSKLISSGKHIDLIDVRTPIEFRALHVTRARMPWNQVKPETTVTPNATSKTCSSTASGCCN